MSEASDVRATFQRFPGWTQHFWTWLTGKALPNQRPLFRHNWLSYLTFTIATFFAGISLSVFAIMSQFDLRYLVLFGGWILSLSAARAMILIVAHQCIHNRFAGNHRLDRFIGELVTVLNVYQDLQTFRIEHFTSHHNEATFATSDDPPVQVLLGLGFRPGMSRRQLWRRAMIVFLSPMFYLQGFGERLKCNLVTGTWRRLGFLAWAGFWLSLPLWLAQGWQVLLLAFVIPIIVLSQLSALLDKLGEHAWLTARDPEHGSRYYHVSATWARFCGSPVPDGSLAAWVSLVEWLRWFVSMALYHLPVRLLVVVGDLPNHDFHHRYPATQDWMVAAYARQLDIDAGMPRGPPYSEVWGLREAIDRMFVGMSRAHAVAVQNAVLEVAPHASLDR